MNVTKKLSSKITNFFRIIETRLIWGHEIIIIKVELELAENCDGRVAYLALVVAQSPPVPLVVKHFQQLACFDRQLLLVVGLSVMCHLKYPATTTTNILKLANCLNWNHK